MYLKQSTPYISRNSGAELHQRVRFNWGLNFLFPRTHSIFINTEESLAKKKSPWIVGEITELKLTVNPREVTGDVQKLQAIPVTRLIT